MEDLRFEWDEKKNEINIKKHGVSFEEARTAFYDENSKVEYDEEHSIDEERFILIGKSIKEKLLFVVHCYRKAETIRIISARRANIGEQVKYEGGLYD